MIDNHLLLSKAGKVERCLARIVKKRPETIEEFLANQDLQEIILFNLQLAVQNCIDMASHILSDQELGIPGSYNEMFYILQDNGYLELSLTEKMVAAVGFRNLVAHEYENVDLIRVYEIVQTDIFDLKDFLRAILQKCDLK